MYIYSMKKVTPNSDEKVLENFMKEFFPFNEFKKAGIFTKEMKGDYKAQSEKIRIFFGYDSIYEYGAETIHCHITYAKGKRPKGEGMITTIR